MTTVHDSHSADDGPLGKAASGLAIGVLVLAGLFVGGIVAFMLAMLIFGMALSGGSTP